MTIKFRRLSPAKKEAIAVEVKRMLKACRQSMQLQGKDIETETFDIRHADYGEAYGILRALAVLGYGEFGAVFVPGTLNHWLHDLEEEVLKETGWRAGRPRQEPVEFEAEPEEQ